VIKICLIGLSKNSSEMAKLILGYNDIELVSMISAPFYESEKNHGTSSGEKESLERILVQTKPDVVIDFSSREAVMKNAAVIAKHQINMVIGTKGLTIKELEKVQEKFNGSKGKMLYAPL